MIKVDDITLKYSNGKGIENVSFENKEGQVVGYLGPNGAGKTTTIRCLMGFSKADKGACLINGLDCYKDAAKIQRFLGYIPGEISFIDNMSGNDFLKFISQMRGKKDESKMKELLDMFEVSSKGKIKKYSKGMKQKIGIIAAFMHNPEVIILDEPTSGLDPLMQNRFVELILEEKKRGKTILMSSHIFEEVERTCDEIIIIKNGKIIKKAETIDLRQSQRKSYILETGSTDTYKKLLEAGFEFGEQVGEKREIFAVPNQIQQLMNIISNDRIVTFESKKQTLEDIFLSLYSKEGEVDEMDSSKN